MLWLLLAGDLYVDNLKGDDATGKPFKTIAKAIEAAKDGDVLHLAKTEAPYRESIVISKSLTLDGHGATLTGLDPLDKAAFAEHSPGIYKIRLPDWAKAQPRAVFDGETMPGQGMLKEIEPGEHLWQRDTLYVYVPEGKSWDAAAVDLRVRRDGVVVKNAVGVVIRNLIAEQWEGDAFRVEGTSEGVRLEACSARRAVGGESRGLAVRDTATVAAERCEFRQNGIGAQALHRSRTAFNGCRFIGNQNVGARVNGVEHAFEDCVFQGNGGPDLMALSLSPESSNGGGPSNLRVLHCFLGGLSVQLGEHGGEARVSASVFRKSVTLRSGTWIGDFNLYAKLENEDGELALEAWRTSTQSDPHSESPAEFPKAPYRVAGKDIGPRY